MRGDGTNRESKEKVSSYEGTVQAAPIRIPYSASFTSSHLVVCTRVHEEILGQLPSQSLAHFLQMCHLIFLESLLHVTVCTGDNIPQDTMMQAGTKCTAGKGQGLWIVEQVGSDACCHSLHTPASSHSPFIGQHPGHSRSKPV